MMENQISIEEMREALEQYYEAAGFSNVEEKVLREKTDEEIVQMYKEINEEIDEF